MKKTLFTLLACATLVTPALAESGTVDGSFSLYLTMEQLNLGALNGNGTCTTLSTAYTADTLNAIKLTVPSTITVTVSVSYDQGIPQYNGGMIWSVKPAGVKPFSGTATLSSQVWDDGKYVMTYNYSIAYNLSTIERKSSQGTTGFSSMSSASVSVEAQPASLTSHSSEDYDYSNAEISATVSYANPRSQTVSSWTVSGATPKSTTPEPATAPLSLLALAGLAVRRRRH